MKTFCSYFNQGICSSCSNLELDYLSQIHQKQQKLHALLSRFAPFQELPPVISATTHFRNKAKFTVTGTLENLKLGLTGEDDLDQGRDIKDCPLHHPDINLLINSLPEFISLMKLKPYNIKSKSGELKGLIVYHSPESGEMYLRFILRSKESLDRIKKHTPALIQKFPALKSVSANIQPIAHAILEGEEEIFFTSQDFIRHQLGKISMSLHPQGFVQTNQDMARKLYTTAAEWVKEMDPDRFAELFSGQGAFSFFIQEYVKEAIGVEINSEAVMRANETAKVNGWDHLKFFASDASKVKDLVLGFDPEVILVNPPRRGLGEAIQLVKEVKSQYFIYSSCNAETLAQDLEKLKDEFKVVRVQLFDMFPHTDHFETLVLLQSKVFDKKA